MSGDTEGCKPDEPSTSRTVLIKDLHTLFKALGEADGEVSDYSIPSPKVHSAIYPFELKITPKNILGPENDKLPLAHITHHITHLTKVFDAAFKLREWAPTLTPLSRIPFDDALEMTDQLVESTWEVDTANIQLATSLAQDGNHLRVQQIEVSPKSVEDALPATPGSDFLENTDQPGKEELKLSCTATFDTGTEKLTLEIMPSSRQVKVFDITKKLWAWMDTKTVAAKVVLAELLRFAEEILGDEGGIGTTEA
jgi:hypothetical protein